MLQQISAEIIFMKTDDPGPVIQKLLEIAYNFEVLRWDWHDGTKPDTTVTVKAITEFDAFAFFDHVQAIVGPLGGDVITADLVSLPSLGSCRPANHRRRRP
jgi:hypothetical protein